MPHYPYMEDRQTDRQTERQTDRQTDRQNHLLNPAIYKWGKKNMATPNRLHMSEEVGQG